MIDCGSDITKTGFVYFEGANTMSSGKSGIHEKMLSK